MAAKTAGALIERPGVQRRDAAAVLGVLPWRLTAAATLLGAAALHGLAAAEHAQHWPTASDFFVGLQLAQTWLGFALLLNLRTSSSARAALALNGATLALWAVSRTIGLPVGPDSGAAEPVARLDLAVALLQILSIAAVLVLLGRWQRTTRTGALLRAPATVAVVLFGVVLITTWGLRAPGAAGERDAPASSVISTHHE